jgi:hypothetical protein
VKIHFTKVEQKFYFYFAPLFTEGAVGKSGYTQ